jgi:hypothetical protein
MLESIFIKLAFRRKKKLCIFFFLFYRKKLEQLKLNEIQNQEKILTFKPVINEYSSKF